MFRHRYELRTWSAQPPDTPGSRSDRPRAPQTRFSLGSGANPSANPRKSAQIRANRFKSGGWPHEPLRNGVSVHNTRRASPLEGELCETFVFDHTALRNPYKPLQIPANPCKCAQICANAENLRFHKTHTRRLRVLARQSSERKIAPVSVPASSCSISKGGTLHSCSSHVSATPMRYSVSGQPMVWRIDVCNISLSEIFYIEISIDLDLANSGKFAKICRNLPKFANICKRHNTGFRWDPRREIVQGSVPGEDTY